MNVLFEREVKKLCKDLEWEEVVLVLLGVLDGVNGENEVYDDFKMSIEAYKDDKKKKEQNVGMCQQNVGEISKKQTDGDLISRESVKDLIRGLTKWGVRSQDGKFENVGLLYDDVMFGIDRLPSAEKTAEWIKQKSGDELFPEEIVCSKCYHSNSHLDFDEHNNPIGKVFFTSKYCPNCGRRMKGEPNGKTKTQP